MPGRLIGIILGIGLLVAFIALNLHNVCDISFGFYTLSGIPVFLIILTSFAFGLIAALPTVFAAYLHAHRVSKQIDTESSRTKAENGSEAKPAKVSRARKKNFTKEDPFEAKEFGIN